MDKISFGQVYRIWCSSTEQKDYLKEYGLPLGKVIELKEPFESKNDSNKLLFIPKSQMKEFEDLAYALAKQSHVPSSEYFDYAQNKINTLISNAERNALDVMA